MTSQSLVDYGVFSKVPLRIADAPVIGVARDVRGAGEPKKSALHEALSGGVTPLAEQGTSAAVGFPPGLSSSNSGKDINNASGGGAGGAGAGVSRVATSSSGSGAGVISLTPSVPVEESKSLMELALEYGDILGLGAVLFSDGAIASGSSEEKAHPLVPMPKVCSTTPLEDSAVDMELLAGAGA